MGRPKKRTEKIEMHRLTAAHTALKEKVQANNITVRTDKNEARLRLPNSLHRVNKQPTPYPTWGHYQNARMTNRYGENQGTRLNVNKRKTKTFCIAKSGEPNIFLESTDVIPAHERHETIKQWIQANIEFARGQASYNNTSSWYSSPNSKIDMLLTIGGAILFVVMIINLL